jgi:hypothetical protein
MARNRLKEIARLERAGLSHRQAIKAAGHPRRRGTPTRPPGERTDYSHPDCYARVLEDCSREISREHGFSKGVLLEIGNRIEASGFSWQKEGEMQLLPPAALASKVLCTRHNSALSPLDKAAKELYAILRRIDGELGDEAPLAQSEMLTVNGVDVERWLLKALIGVAHSHKPPDELRDEEMCLRVLFGEASLKQPWGLYVDGSKDSHAFNGLSMSVLHGSEGTILGARFNISGLRVLLALGKADGTDLSFRPSGLHFEHAHRPGIKVVTLAWWEPPFSDFVRYRRSQPYHGEPVDHF